ncbi:hypothetical protein LIER_07043 [Lithospermum erythrorhizon]|uniref:CCHC-type domain-containing protein n=1 Tax=Lithospermum erythrorhizon TaxID=34254 RepID=A0AAV3P6S7_LITER
MSSSSESSQLPDYLDRRGWIVPANLESTTQDQERLTRTPPGVFSDAEFFSADPVQQYVNTHWFLRGQVNIERRGSIYFFAFNQDDKDIVGVNGPYNVNRALLLLANWTPNMSLQNFNIIHTNLWMQQHGIPIEYFHQETLLNLARTAGEIIAADWHADGTRALQFARIKIRVAINAPLITGNYLHTLENIPTWLTFKYEKIFRACYHCGRVGHSILHCRYSAQGTLNNYFDQLAREQKAHTLERITQTMIQVEMTMMMMGEE